MFKNGPKYEAIKFVSVVFFVDRLDLEGFNDPQSDVTDYQKRYQLPAWSFAAQPLGV